MKDHMNEDNIRVAAYYIWEQAGRPEGKEKECWIKACEQLFAAGANSECCCNNNDYCCDDDCCTPKSTKCKSSSKSTKSCSSKTSSKSSTKCTSTSSVAKAAKACASRIKKSLA